MDFFVIGVYGYLSSFQNPNNWRPGQLVGGISNSVNGFVQDLTRFIPF